MLGPVTGLRVLDVACGHGRITRELARRGASVVGIDISGVLISKAREIEQDEPLGIRYVHDDVTTPGSLRTSSLNRSRNQTGTRPMTPTASPSTSWP